MSPTKRKGHVSRTSFKPGQSGNPSGKKPLPPDLKQALAANSLPLYEKGLALLKKLEKAKDFNGAARLLLGLLKKSLPDAAETLQLANPDGSPLSIGAAELRAMSDEDLATLRAIAERTARAPKP